MFLSQKSRLWLSCISAVSVLSVSATQANADTIRLLSKDGSTDISGEYKGFSENAYIVDVPQLGLLRVTASLVDCIGDACPFQRQDPNEEIVFDDVASEPVAIPTDAEQINIVGSELIAGTLLSDLVSKYSTSQGLLATGETASDGRQVFTVTESDDPNAITASFNVVSSSSANAFESLADPSVNFGLSTRRIEAQEARDLRDTNAGTLNNARQQYLMAIDNLAVSVNTANDISTISLEDIARIYAGEITNWSQLGGRDAPITIYSRQPSSGAHYAFVQQVMDTAGLSITPTAVVSETNDAMAENIQSDINAIGFVSATSIDSVKPVTLEMSCGLTFYPTEFTAKTEEYPIRNELYFYNRDDNLTVEASEFLAFVRSAQIDEIVTNAGFANLAVAASPQDIQTSRVRILLEEANRPDEFRTARDLVLDMLDWERLSTTFRFSSGSARLDAQGRLELDRLVQFLSQQSPDIEIAVVGFTDSDGAFGPNQALSLSRAAIVTDQIRAQAANVSLETKGFGELSPVACNDTVDGKRLNRRVEVWIRRQS